MPGIAGPVQPDMRKIHGRFRFRPDRASVVFLAATAVFANTLWNGFVFDDMQNIVQNRWIKDVRFLPEIFSSHAAGFDPKFSTSYYRPLMHVINMVIYHLCGLRPAGFHLVSVLLHAMVSVLAYLVVRELAKRDTSCTAGNEFVPFVVGLLFATHPIHTESVAWLAGITDLSFVFFALWAFFFYVRADSRGTMGYALAGLFFFAAALCKEPALMLLPLIVIYEAAFRRAYRVTEWPRLVKRLWPLAFAAVLYVLLRIRALGGFVPAASHGRYAGPAPLLSALDLFADYLYKMLLPVRLNALHVFSPVDFVFDTRLIPAVAACVAVAAMAWSFRRRPVVVTGLAFVVLPLLPVLYIPALGEGVFAERYLYLPSLGFAILLALGMQRVRDRWPWGTVWVAVLAGFLLLSYTAGSVTRNRVWADSLSLWTDTAEKSPTSAAAHEYLCYARYEAGRPREALESCRRALELDAGRIDARANLAMILSVLGDLDGAIAEFMEVLRLRPDFAEAYTNLGLTYSMLQSR
ncbi:MAG: tetratricopeptide repeat protein [bacterium]